MTRQDYLAFGKPNFSEEEIAAVTRVLRSGWVGMGPETLAFEQELAAYLKVPHVVTVNSCTSALFLSLLVAGVGAGDEVICPSLTWCSTANAALYLGAKPVFCDIDPHTFCVSPETILDKLTPRTKAVMVVHFGGLAVDVHAVRAVLPKHVAIVEDAAHAFGAKFKDGTPVGASGSLTCFSFYANKNLSTGDGGAIGLFDPEVADRLRSLRQHATPIDAWKRFTHPRSLLYSQLTELGYKMHYTDLQACIGRVQLKRQTKFQERRLRIAGRYHELLTYALPSVRMQVDILNPYHARHLFQLVIPDKGLSRDALLRQLRERNIGASVHYAPLHRMPLYNTKVQPLLPATEALASCLLTLPISASMVPEDADYVASAVIKLLSGTNARP